MASFLSFIGNQPETVESWLSERIQDAPHLILTVPGVGQPQEFHSACHDPGAHLTFTLVPTGRPTVLTPGVLWVAQEWKPTPGGAPSPLSSTPQDSLKPQHPYNFLFLLSTAWELVPTLQCPGFLTSFTDALVF